jgi:hypothetical protein
MMEITHMSLSWQASRLARLKKKIPIIPSTNRGEYISWIKNKSISSFASETLSHYITFYNVLSLLHSFDIQACSLPRPRSLETNLEGKSEQVSLI